MSEDPILSALEGVEDEQPTDPGAGHEEIGEEPDARPEGPMPDLEDEPADEEEGFSVLSWAERIPEGSHREFDRTDWWDPDGGGLNRLAFHLSDAAGAGAGYPNGVGVLVAVAEEYWSRVQEQQGHGDESDEGDEAPDAESVDRSTAEALT